CVRFREMRMCRKKRSPGSAARTTQCSVYCQAPSRARCSEGSASSVHRIVSACLVSLHCPPGKKLARDLGEKEPVVRDFIGGTGVRLNDEAVVELVAVELDRVVGIDLGRDDLGLFQITKPRPATLPIPVLA